MFKKPTAGKSSILFVVQYPENVSPGQRFRFELYKPLLRENGFKVITAPFIGPRFYPVIFKKGFLFTKLLAVMIGFLKRIRLCLNCYKYDYIFIQLGITPVGPPVFEWLLSRVFNKKIIFDFDGSIWVEQVSENNRISRMWRFTGKAPLICKWSYKVSCGNEFLCKYARQYNSHVVYNPTCVDTENRHNIITDHDVPRITIGWTGSFSTLPYLQLVAPVLKKLQQQYDFSFKIISNKHPELDLKNIEYIEWTPDNEVKELATCHIGLMPLTHDEWSEGKCGFKIIQYMALAIPAIASPVGVNKKIIDEGVNGYLCDTEEQWYVAIEKLLLDAELRKQMGREGRKKIINEYSLQSNSENFLALFR